jgi:hypothetical protein
MLSAIDRNPVRNQSEHLSAIVGIRNPATFMACYANSRRPRITRITVLRLDVNASKRSYQHGVGATNDCFDRDKVR